MSNSGRFIYSIANTPPITNNNTSVKFNVSIIRARNRTAIIVYNATVLKINRRKMMCHAFAIVANYTIFNG